MSFPAPAAVSRACAKYEKKPLRNEDVSARLRTSIETMQTRGASALHRRQLRYIVSAIGNSDLLDAPTISAALDEVGRREDGRLSQGVFNALLGNYCNEELRALLSRFLLPRVGELRDETQAFVRACRVLDSNVAEIEAVARDLALAGDLNACCLSKHINRHILASEYGHALKLATITCCTHDSEPKDWRNILEWAFSELTGTPSGDYYETILTPFLRRDPSHELQNVIMSTLIQRFGDPRLHHWPGLTGRNSVSRRDGCVATVRRWLSIEYLDLFIQIIEKTAVDRQFRPRKQFWMRYFEHDKVAEVTLILASDADKVARRMQTQLERADYMKWGKLSGALPDQSVLLMKIGDLIITEWSHSGAMRFWRSDDKSAPKFHGDEYFGSSLRTEGLKIKVGNSWRKSLVHHENGNWMALASRMIAHHTGVSV